MAEHFYYYHSEWRDLTFCCSGCVWSGQTTQMEKEVLDQTIEFSCSQCEKTLVIVSLPNSRDLKAAVVAGNSEATTDLAKKDDMPHVLCICYELSEQGEQEFVGLSNAIKELGSCCRPTPSLWLAETSLTPDQVVDSLSPHLHGPDDKLLVFTAAMGHEWCLQGGSSDNDETTAVWMQDNVREHGTAETFDDLEEALKYVVDHHIRFRRRYIVTVRERPRSNLSPPTISNANAAMVQFVAEDIAFKNGGVGLTIHLMFDSSWDEFEQYVEFDGDANEFHRWVKDNLHCYSRRLGADAPFAAYMLQDILRNFYGYKDLSGFEYEVHDEGPVKALPADTSYYADQGTIFACVGPMASNGVFRFVQDSRRGNDEWTFFPPGSPTWDAINQEIFHNFRMSEISDISPPVGLPPLPDLPEGPFPKWGEYFLPKEALSVSTFPLTAELTRQQERQTLCVFVILGEDVYETHSGDGEFHYFEAAFLTKQEAEEYIAQSKEGKCHLRTMQISLLDDSFNFPEFKMERYDRHKPEEVLTDLEKRLGPSEG